MAIKACKFGGSSLADAEQIRRAAAIVADDPARRYVVPSAPGKRFDEDAKVTDLLALCHAHAAQRIPFDDVWERIAERFRGIVDELGSGFAIGEHLAAIQAEIARRAEAGESEAYAVSRGEYLNGLILAELLGVPFVDAAEVIRFDEHDRLDSATTHALLARNLGEAAVVPGFYGARADGGIRTFSRGGSDVSGALVARGVSAAEYENWTDVSGLLMTDPRVVESPRAIDVITYQELRELAYMGATVLHDEAIFPVREAGIPAVIKNTNDPADAGTRIVSEADPVTHRGMISGIAGRKDFAVIAIEKALMNQQVGFGRRVLSVIEDNGISYEHTPSSIDTMSVVVAASELDGKRDRVVEELTVECEPDKIEVFGDMALIATVGRGMAHTPGMASRVFGALADAGVNVRMIDQGSSEINIIIGVENSDYERAVRAIYHAFL